MGGAGRKGDLVMPHVKQGEIILIEGNRQCALVLSRDLFNRTGLAVLCPVMKSTSADALHIPVSYPEYEGIAMIEQLKTFDLNKRLYQTIAQLSYDQIQNLTDAVQAIFDYYPYG